MDAVREAYVGSRSEVEELGASHQALRAEASRLSQRLAAKLDTAAIRCFFLLPFSGNIVLL